MVTQVSLYLHLVRGGRISGLHCTYLVYSTKRFEAYLGTCRRPNGKGKELRGCDGPFQGDLGKGTSVAFDRLADTAFGAVQLHGTDDASLLYEGGYVYVSAGQIEMWMT